MRSMWKGSLSFGLVNIPIEMYLASREREFKFALLHDVDFSPIHYARICKEEEKEVAWSHVVKGYETEKGKYIVMSDEDFAKANLARSDSIDIKQFADAEEIDSIYFEKPYYLEPQRGASKAYTLFRTALKKSNKVGIGTYVIHNRAHLGVIKAHDDVLVLNQLRFDSEIIKASELKIPKAKIGTKEIDMALELVNSMSSHFAPEKYKDTYSAELRKVIQRKSKGQKIAIAPQKRVREAKVYDLISALKASLEEKSKKRA